MAKYRCVKDFECEVCRKKGLLQIISKSYARVRHYSHLDPATKKPQFIYHRQTLAYVQNMLKSADHSGLEADQLNHDLKKPNSVFKSGTVEPPPGFEPGIFSLQGRTDDHYNAIDWSSFRAWIFQKYSHSYGNLIWSYSKRFYPLLNGNLRDIDMIPATVRNNVVKSLIVLAKFLGIHNDFKKRLKDYGVKLSRPDAFASFMRIYSNHSSDLAKWYSEAMNAMRPNEKIWLKFLSQTGIRKEEAITSFNKIVELAKENQFSNYFNEELNVLEHFRFKELFLRGTKNVYVSIVPKSLVLEVASTQPVSYAAIRKRLKSNNLSCRMNELRDYFGTYLVKHGLIKEEVDLLQGRIPPSIFLRHYWSPSFKELRDRTLEATTQLEKVLTKIMKTEALTIRVKYLEGKGW